MPRRHRRRVGVGKIRLARIILPRHHAERQVHADGLSRLKRGRANLRVAEDQQDRGAESHPGLLRPRRVVDPRENRCACAFDGGGEAVASRGRVMG